MTFTYIYHSAYAIENNDALVVVDFFEDAASNAYPDGFEAYLKKTKKPVYILSTHSHPDHFNQKILFWRNDLEKVKYIFCREIFQKQVAKNVQATYLNLFEEYVDETIKIQAFGSTDIGGSFYIELGGKKIFHAGDLNNWHWQAESTKQEIERAQRQYDRQLERLFKRHPVLDVAMFPIDSRMGKNYFLGAKEFVEKIKVATLLPMHFWDKYDLLSDFDDAAKENSTTYIKPTHKAFKIEVE